MKVYVVVHPAGFVWRYAEEDATEYAKEEEAAGIKVRLCSCNVPNDADRDTITADVERQLAESDILAA